MGVWWGFNEVRKEEPSVTARHIPVCTVLLLLLLLLLILPVSQPGTSPSALYYHCTALPEKELLYNSD